MKKIKFRQRLFASVISLIFLFNGLQPVPVQAAEGSSASAKPFSKDLNAIRIPENLGEVQDIYKGESGQTVVLIQDAHSVPDAQRSIRALIEYFETFQGVSLVALEGSASRLDTQIFKSFPDKELLEKTLEKYSAKGELAGGVAAAILNQGDSLYHGAENWELYEEGLELYSLAADKTPALNSGLAIRRKQIEEKKKTLYSPELLEIDSGLRRFAEDSEDFAGILEKITAVLPPAKGSDLEALTIELRKAPFESAENGIRDLAKQISGSLSRVAAEDRKKFNDRLQDFQTSRLSPEDFLLYLKDLASVNEIPVSFSPALRGVMHRQVRLNAIKGSEVFSEFTAHAEAVKNNLFRSREEAELDAESRRLDLLEKFVRLELSCAEWQELKSMPASVIDEGFKFHFGFYENAMKRDGAFMENLEALMKKNERSEALLVSGGFHTEGMKEILRAKKISYLTVIPAIEHAPEESFYRAQMKGEVSWKDYLRPERGKLSVSGAFIRATRDELLRSGGQPLLKSWRDRIIRDLAERERTADAGRYLPFIDETLGRNSEESFVREWKENIDRFLKRMQKLESVNSLTVKNVRNLFSASKIIPRVSGPAVVAPEDRFTQPYQLSARANTELDTAFRARSEVRASNLGLNAWKRAAGGAIGQTPEDLNDPIGAVTTAEILPRLKKLAGDGARILAVGDGTLHVSLSLRKSLEPSAKYPITVFEPAVPTEQILLGEVPTDENYRIFNRPVEVLDPRNFPESPDLVYGLFSLEYTDRVKTLEVLKKISGEHTKFLFGFHAGGSTISGHMRDQFEGFRLTDEFLEISLRYINDQIPLSDYESGTRLIFQRMTPEFVDAVKRIEGKVLTDKAAAQAQVRTVMRRNLSAYLDFVAQYAPFEKNGPDLLRKAGKELLVQDAEVEALAGHFGQVFESEDEIRSFLSANGFEVDSIEPVEIRKVTGVYFVQFHRSELRAGKVMAQMWGELIRRRLSGESAETDITKASTEAMIPELIALAGNGARILAVGDGDFKVSRTLREKLTPPVSYPITVVEPGLDAQMLRGTGLTELPAFTISNRPIEEITPLMVSPQDLIYGLFSFEYTNRKKTLEVLKNLSHPGTRFLFGFHMKNADIYAGVRQRLESLKAAVEFMLTSLEYLEGKATRDQYDYIAGEAWRVMPAEMSEPLGPVRMTVERLALMGNRAPSLILMPFIAELNRQYLVFLSEYFAYVAQFAPFEDPNSDFIDLAGNDLEIPQAEITALKSKMGQIFESEAQIRAFLAENGFTVDSVRTQVIIDKPAMFIVQFHRSEARVISAQDLLDTVEALRAIAAVPSTNTRPEWLPVWRQVEKLNEIFKRLNPSWIKFNAMGHHGNGGLWSLHYDTDKLLIIEKGGFPEEKFQLRIRHKLNTLDDDYAQETVQAASLEEFVQKLNRLIRLELSLKENESSPFNLEISGDRVRFALSLSALTGSPLNFPELSILPENSGVLSGLFISYLLLSKAELAYGKKKEIAPVNDFPVKYRILSVSLAAFGLIGGFAAWYFWPKDDTPFAVPQQLNRVDMQAAPFMFRVDAEAETVEKFNRKDLYEFTPKAAVLSPVPETFVRVHQPDKNTITGDTHAPTQGPLHILIRPGAGKEKFEPEDDFTFGAKVTFNVAPGKGVDPGAARVILSLKFKGRDGDEFTDSYHVPVNTDLRAYRVPMKEALKRGDLVEVSLLAHPGIPSTYTFNFNGELEMPPVARSESRVWHQNKIEEGIDEEAVAEGLREIQQDIDDIRFELQEFWDSDEIEYWIDNDNYTDQVIDQYEEAIRLFNKNILKGGMTRQKIQAYVLQSHITLGQNLIHEAGKYVQYQDEADEIFDELFSEAFAEKLKVDPVAAAAEIFAELVNLQSLHDGNKRSANLVMNYILLKMGYTPFILNRKNAVEYMRLVYPVGERTRVSATAVKRFLREQVHPVDARSELRTYVGEKDAGFISGQPWLDWLDGKLDPANRRAVIGFLRTLFVEDQERDTSLADAPPIFMLDDMLTEYTRASLGLPEKGFPNRDDRSLIVLKLYSKWKENGMEKEYGPLAFWLSRTADSSGGNIFAGRVSVYLRNFPNPLESLLYGWIALEPHVSNIGPHDEKVNTGGLRGIEPGADIDSQNYYIDTEILVDDLPVFFREFLRQEKTLSEKHTYSEVVSDREFYFRVLAGAFSRKIHTAATFARMVAELRDLRDESGKSLRGEVVRFLEEASGRSLREWTAEGLNAPWIPVLSRYDHVESEFLSMMAGKWLLQAAAEQILIRPLYAGFDIYPRYPEASFPDYQNGLQAILDGVKGRSELRADDRAVRGDNYENVVRALTVQGTALLRQEIEKAAPSKLDSLRLYSDIMYFIALQAAAGREIRSVYNKFETLKMNENTRAGHFKEYLEAVITRIVAKEITDKDRVEAVGLASRLEGGYHFFEYTDERVIADPGDFTTNEKKELVRKLLAPAKNPKEDLFLKSLREVTGNRALTRNDLAAEPVHVGHIQAGAYQDVYMVTAKLADGRTASFVLMAGKSPQKSKTVLREFENLKKVAGDPYVVHVMDIGHVRTGWGRYFYAYTSHFLDRHDEMIITGGKFKFNSFPISQKVVRQDDLAKVVSEIVALPVYFYNPQKKERIGNFEVNSGDANFPFDAFVDDGDSQVQTAKRDWHARMIAWRGTVKKTDVPAFLSWLFSMKYMIDKRLVFGDPEYVRGILKGLFTGLSRKPGMTYEGARKETISWLRQYLAAVDAGKIKGDGTVTRYRIESFIKELSRPRSELRSAAARLEKSIGYIKRNQKIPAGYRDEIVRKLGNIHQTLIKNPEKSMAAGNLSAIVRGLRAILEDERINNKSFDMIPTIMALLYLTADLERLLLRKRIQSVAARYNVSVTISDKQVVLKAPVALKENLEAAADGLRQLLEYNTAEIKTEKGIHKIIMTARSEARTVPSVHFIRFMGAIEKAAKEMGISSTRFIEGKLLNIGLESKGFGPKSGLTSRNLVTELRKVGIDIVGISPEAVTNEQEGIYQGIVQQIPFEDERFEVVVVIGLFDSSYWSYYIPEPDAQYRVAVEEIRRVLAPGGMVLVDTYNVINPVLVAAFFDAGFDVINVSAYEYVFVKSRSEARAQIPKKSSELLKGTVDYVKYRAALPEGVREEFLKVLEPIQEELDWVPEQILPSDRLKLLIAQLRELITDKRYSFYEEILGRSMFVINRVKINLETELKKRIPAARFTAEGGFDRLPEFVWGAAHEDALAAKLAGLMAPEKEDPKRSELRQMKNEDFTAALDEFRNILENRDQVLAILKEESGNDPEKFLELLMKHEFTAGGKTYLPGRYFPKESESYTRSPLSLIAKEKGRGTVLKDMFDYYLMRFLVQISEGVLDADSGPRNFAELQAALDRLNEKSEIVTVKDAESLIALRYSLPISDEKEYIRIVDAWYDLAEKLPLPVRVRIASSDMVTMLRHLGRQIVKASFSYWGMREVNFGDYYALLRAANILLSVYDGLGVSAEDARLRRQIQLSFFLLFKIDGLPFEDTSLFSKINLKFMDSERLEAFRREFFTLFARHRKAMRDGLETEDWTSPHLRLSLGINDLFFEGFEKRMLLFKLGHPEYSKIGVEDTYPVPAAAAEPDTLEKIVPGFPRADMDFFPLADLDIEVALDGIFPRSEVRNFESDLQTEIYLEKDAPVLKVGSRRFKFIKGEDEDEIVDMDRPSAELSQSEYRFLYQAFLSVLTLMQESRLTPEISAVMKKFPVHFSDITSRAVLSLGEGAPSTQLAKPLFRTVYTAGGIEVQAPNGKVFLISRYRGALKLPPGLDKGDEGLVLQQILKTFIFLPAYLNEETRERALEAYRSGFFVEPVSKLMPVISRSEARAFISSPYPPRAENPAEDFIYLFYSQHETPEDFAWLKPAIEDAVQDAKEGGAEGLTFWFEQGPDFNMFMQLFSQIAQTYSGVRPEQMTAYAAQFGFTAEQMKVLGDFVLGGAKKYRDEFPQYYGDPAHLPAFALIADYASRKIESIIRGGTLRDSFQKSQLDYASETGADYLLEGMDAEITQEFFLRQTYSDLIHDAVFTGKEADARKYTVLYRAHNKRWMQLRQEISERQLAEIKAKNPKRAVLMLKGGNHKHEHLNLWERGVRALAYRQKGTRSFTPLNDLFQADIENLKRADEDLVVSHHFLYMLVQPAARQAVRDQELSTLITRRILNGQDLLTGAQLSAPVSSAEAAEVVSAIAANRIHPEANDRFTRGLQLLFRYMSEKGKWHAQYTDFFNRSLTVPAAQKENFVRDDPPARSEARAWMQKEKAFISAVRKLDPDKDYRTLQALRRGLSDLSIPKSIETVQLPWGLLGKVMNYERETAALLALFGTKENRNESTRSLLAATKDTREFQWLLLSLFVDPMTGEYQNLPFLQRIMKYQNFTELDQTAETLTLAGNYEGEIEKDWLAPEEDEEESDGTGAKSWLTDIVEWGYGDLVRGLIAERPKYLRSITAEEIDATEASIGRMPDALAKREIAQARAASIVALKAVLELWKNNTRFSPFVHDETGNMDILPSLQDAIEFLEKNENAVAGFVFYFNYTKDEDPAGYAQRLARQMRDIRDIYIQEVTPDAWRAPVNKGLRAVIASYVNKLAGEAQRLPSLGVTWDQVRATPGREYYQLPAEVELSRYADMVAQADEVLLYDENIGQAKWLLSQVVKGLERLIAEFSIYEGTGNPEVEKFLSRVELLLSQAHQANEQVRQKPEQAIGELRQAFPEEAAVEKMTEIFGSGVLVPVGLATSEMADTIGETVLQVNTEGVSLSGRSAVEYQHPWLYELRVSFPIEEDNLFDVYLGVELVLTNQKTGESHTANFTSHREMYSAVFKGLESGIYKLRVSRSEVRTDLAGLNASFKVIEDARKQLREDLERKLTPGIRKKANETVWTALLSDAVLNVLLAYEGADWQAIKILLKNNGVVFPPAAEGGVKGLLPSSIRTVRAQFEAQKQLFNSFLDPLGVPSEVERTDFEKRYKVTTYPGTTTFVPVAGFSSVARLPISAVSFKAATAIMKDARAAIAGGRTHISEPLTDPALLRILGAEAVGVKEFRILYQSLSVAERDAFMAHMRRILPEGSEDRFNTLLTVDLNNFRNRPEAEIVRDLQVIQFWRGFIVSYKVFPARRFVDMAAAYAAFGQENILPEEILSLFTTITSAEMNPWIDTEEGVTYFDTLRRVNPSVRFVPLKGGDWLRDQRSYLTPGSDLVVVSKDRARVRELRRLKIDNYRTYDWNRPITLDEGGAVIPGTATSGKVFALFSEALPVAERKMAAAELKKRPVPGSAYSLPAGFATVEEEGVRYRIISTHLDLTINIIDPEFTADGRAKILVDSAYFKKLQTHPEFLRLLVEQGFTTADILLIPEEKSGLILTNFAAIRTPDNERKLIFNHGAKELLGGILKPEAYVETAVALQGLAIHSGLIRCAIQEFPEAELPTAPLVNYNVKAGVDQRSLAVISRFLTQNPPVVERLRLLTKLHLQTILFLPAEQGSQFLASVLGAPEQTAFLIPPGIEEDELERKLSEGIDRMIARLQAIWGRFADGQDIPLMTNTENAGNLSRDLVAVYAENGNQVNDIAAFTARVKTILFNGFMGAPAGDFTAGLKIDLYPIWQALSGSERSEPEVYLSTGEYRRLQRILRDYIDGDEIETLREKLTAFFAEYPVTPRSELRYAQKDAVKLVAAALAPDTAVAIAVKIDEAALADLIDQYRKNREELRAKLFAQADVSRFDAVQSVMNQADSGLEKIAGYGTRRFAVGLVLPKNFTAQGTQFLEGFVAGLDKDTVGELLKDGKAPEFFAAAMKRFGIRLRDVRVDKTSAIQSEQGKVPAALLENREKVDDMFLPMFLDPAQLAELQKKNPEAARWIGKVISRALIHLADLLENDALKGKPEALRDELLKRLNLFEKDYSNFIVLTGKNGRLGFGINTRLAEAMFENLVARTIESAA